MAEPVDILNDTARPRLAPHARLHHDKSRNRWVVLLPERVLVPDPVAIDILQRCDGTRMLSEVIDALAAEYFAEREQIDVDVRALLHDLQRKGAVVTA